MCPTLPLFNPSRDIQLWLASLELDYSRVMDSEWESRVTMQGKTVDEWCAAVLRGSLHPSQLPKRTPADLVDWMASENVDVRVYGLRAIRPAA